MIKLTKNSTLTNEIKKTQDKKKKLKKIAIQAIEVIELN